MVIPAPSECGGDGSTGGRKDDPWWKRAWDRFTDPCNPMNAMPFPGGFGAAGSGPRAVGAGAKSLGNFLKHQSQLQNARRALRDLMDRAARATGPKARNAIQQEIDDLMKWIRGHEKEMRQKWPNGEPK